MFRKKIVLKCIQLGNKLIINQTKSLADESILKSKATEFYRLLNQGFLVSQVGLIFDYLFHIPKKSIIYLRDLYFKLVFSDKFENNVSFYQLHYNLCDLYMHKIEPFVLPTSIVYED